MANQLSSLLAQWYPRRDDCEWVLGTVYKTEGPCYRKAGAMMLFNSLGQQFGMLSGGCLESDIQTHARKVMQTGIPLTLCYDGSDEDDLSFQLGIGCGGTVYVMLNLITAANRYQQLDKLYLQLKNRVAGLYYQIIPEQGETQDALYLPIDQGLNSAQKTRLTQTEGKHWLVTAIEPEPHILVVGGGIDARPLVTMAAQMGWTVSLWDPRPANARREFFLEANQILDANVADLGNFVGEQKVNAAVVMSHNIDIDAQAIASLNGSGLDLIALLGPVSRRERVLQLSNLKPEELKQQLSGPAGLDIGGELPESIALSILAECHAMLHGKQLAHSQCTGVEAA